MKYAFQLIITLGLLSLPTLESAETDAEYSQIYENVFGSVKRELLESFGKKVIIDYPISWIILLGPTLFVYSEKLLPGTGNDTWRDS